MPSAQQGVLTNLSGLAFAKAYMYGTIQGGAQLAIAFGALSSIKLTHTYTFAELMGPESLSPLGVGLKDENLSGTWQNGVIVPEQLIMLLGGGQAYDSPSDMTTYTKYVNQEPLPFNLQCQSDLNNAEITYTFFRCVAPTFNMTLNNREFVLGDGAFRVFGETAGGRLFTMARPTNLTNSS